MGKVYITPINKPIHRILGYLQTGGFNFMQFFKSRRLF